MKNKIYSHLPVIMFGVLVISFLAVFYIFAWTEPTADPPGGNVPAPLNTGSEGQVKIGGLMLNTGGFPNGLIVDQGNVGIGTTNPRAPLTVLTGATGPEAGGSMVLELQAGHSSAPAAAGSGIRIDFVDPVLLAVPGDDRLVGQIRTQADGLGLIGMSFHTYDGAAVNERVRILSTGNVGIGTTNPTAKLEVNGDIRAKNGILMAGTVNITADPADPDAGISAPIDVSSFAFSSANAYQISLTSQTPTNGAAAQHPCFAGIPDINGGCFGPLFWPAIANKTATSFRILVHDNLNADVPGLIVPVDYIVVKY